MAALKLCPGVTVAGPVALMLRAVDSVWQPVHAFVCDSNADASGTNIRAVTTKSNSPIFNLLFIFYLSLGGIFHTVIQYIYIYLSIYLRLSRL